MKSFIVASSTLFLFLWIFLQGQNYDMIDFKTTEATLIVQKYAQVARQDGKFTTETKNKILTEIKGRTKFKDEEIVIDELTSVAICRKPESTTVQNQIKYKIRVLIKDVTVGGNLLGIAPADNQYWHLIEGSVSSELVCTG